MTPTYTQCKQNGLVVTLRSALVTRLKTLSYRKVFLYALVGILLSVVFSGALPFIHRSWQLTIWGFFAYTCVLYFFERDKGFESWLKYSAFWMMVGFFCVLYTHSMHLPG